LIVWKSAANIYKTSGLYNSYDKKVNTKIKVTSLTRSRGEIPLVKKSNNIFDSYLDV
jgi:hypothetical protein